MNNWIDRPLNGQVKNFDRMCTELSKYMSEFEVDQVIEFMSKIQGSKWDINPTIEDSKTQLQLILGRERYEEIVMKWKKDNQKLLSMFGRLKYQRKSDGTMWDGLDDEDLPDDYEKVYV